MMTTRLGSGALVLIVALSAPTLAQQMMRVHVDATDLPRKLLRSTLEFDAMGDTVAMLYPEWIPGIHAPRGPLQNLAGFVPRDADGSVLRWERDWSNMYRLLVLRDEGQRSKLTLDLTYITNQPSTNSKGVDAFGTRTLGIINWNTVLVAPEDIPPASLQVELELTLPQGWQAGSALAVASREGDRIRFEPVTYEQLIDRPLICGLRYREVELARTDGATYFLDIVADGFRSSANLKR